MSNDIEYQLRQLRVKIEKDLDRLHDELLAKLRSMAKSVGQRTRVDRVKFK